MRRRRGPRAAAARRGATRSLRRAGAAGSPARTGRMPRSRRRASSPARRRAARSSAPSVWTGYGKVRLRTASLQASNSVETVDPPAGGPSLDRERRRSALEGEAENAARRNGADDARAGGPRRGAPDQAKRALDECLRVLLILGEPAAHGAPDQRA